MDPAIVIGLIAIGCISGGTALALWALVSAAAHLDRRSTYDAESALEDDAFGHSMDRFGYVQDARNRGDV